MDDATPSPETWRPIPGWEGAYDASDQGRIRSLDRTILHRTGAKHRIRGRILKPATTADGYRDVILGGGKHGRVHILVLQAHVGLAPAGMEVCHNDGNPANNTLPNLRWDTRSENHRDKRRHGTDPKGKPSCPLGHRLAAPNLTQSRLPNLDCLACRRATSWAHLGRRTRSERDAYAHQQYQRILTEPVPERPTHGTRAAYERERRAFKAGRGPAPCDACKAVNQERLRRSLRRC